MEKRSVSEVIRELQDINGEIQKLLDELPTADHRIIGRLYHLINQQSRLLSVSIVGRESGTMFLDQARRIALFLKTQYDNARFEGRLHKTVKEGKN